MPYTFHVQCDLLSNANIIIFVNAAEILAGTVQTLHIRDSKRLSLQCSS